MLYRNLTIDKGLKKMARYIKVPKWIVTVMYVLFAAIIVVIEEFITAYETYFAVRKMVSVMKRTKDGDTITPFDQLSLDDQEEYHQHYEKELIRNTRRLQIMAGESSVQLAYQNALVMYQFFYQPVYELNFNSSPYPSAQWIFGLFFQILSILLSGYSTFNPILDNMKFKANVEGKPAGLYNYVITALQVLSHVLLSTVAVFLLLGHKYIFYMTNYIA